MEAIAVDPSNPRFVYASGVLAGVYRSTDRGETWTQLPFEPGAPYLVVVDPRRPSTLYVSADPVQTGGPTMFKSTDSGWTWEPALPS